MFQRQIEYCEESETKLVKRGDVVLYLNVPTEEKKQQNQKWIFLTFLFNQKPKMGWTAAMFVER